MRSVLVAAALDVALTLSSSARAEDPTALFREALRHDLTGEPAEVRRAFDLYRRAADAGLAAAQFNVAVMLDSGRGIPSDIGRAAIWYARAAAHGNKRAAYNLGQLYEAGNGVPRNADLARAWFAASGLPAAKARLAAPRSTAPAAAQQASFRSGGPGATTLAAPGLVSPVNETLAAGARSVELVWTLPQQPEAVRFFVEVRAIEASSSREIFSGFVDVSSLAVPLPSGTPDMIAWRVLTVSRGARYASSAWARLRAAPD